MGRQRQRAFCSKPESRGGGGEAYCRSRDLALDASVQEPKSYKIYYNRTSTRNSLLATILYIQRLDRRNTYEFAQG